MLVGSGVVGSEVVGSDVVGSSVGTGVGSEVVGSDVVGSEVVGSEVVGSNVMNENVWPEIHIRYAKDVRRATGQFRGALRGNAQTCMLTAVSSGLDIIDAAGHIRVLGEQFQSQTSMSRWIEWMRLVSLPFTGSNVDKWQQSFEKQLQNCITLGVYKPEHRQLLLAQMAVNLGQQHDDTRLGFSTISTTTHPCSSGACG